jgi:nicotinate-nucleotide adenylyltransferase
MSRLGILGGTFDPIHLGHLVLASFAAEELELDRVLFMPAQTPPHKIGDVVSAVGCRVEMVRRAIEPDPRFELSELDLLGDKPSYTATLLERLRSLEPDASLVFLIGADSLRDFPTWHDPGRILELAQLGVARRPGALIDAPTMDALPGLRERTTVFASPLIDISSTAVRTRSAEGKSITWLVPTEVDRYIREHRLYRLAPQTQE